MYQYKDYPNIDPKGIDLINERLINPYKEPDEPCYNMLPDKLESMFSDGELENWIINNHENDYSDMDDFLEVIVGEGTTVFDYEKTQKMVGLIETFVKSKQIEHKVKVMNKDFRPEPKTYDECIDMAVDDEDMFQLQEQFLVREYERTHNCKCVKNKDGMWVPENLL